MYATVVGTVESLSVVVSLRILISLNQDKIMSSWRISCDLSPKSAAAGLLAASGLVYAGYKLGRGDWSPGSGGGLSDAVSKSYYGKVDSVKIYCNDHSTPLHDVQKLLFEETKNHKWSRMMGAPEVVNLNAGLIRALGAKKVIDIGVFTGASSLAAALALPSDGIVIGCDVNEDFVKDARRYWKLAGVESKIQLKIAPAVDTLKNLIAKGEAGSFDFAFIDADKDNYDSYYELCLKLLRPGGIIAIDNTLWSGKVLYPAKSGDKGTAAIRALNDKLAKDTARSHVVLMNIGDGYTVVVKK